MSIAFISHLDCELHDTGAGHPERPERLTSTVDYLKRREIWKSLVEHDAPLASKDQLERAHAASYVDSVFESESSEGRVYLDPDTSMAPGSLNAALRAAGSVVNGVDIVMAGTTKQAFCCVRPCGHHAETKRAMGFCLFNNVAVGAKYAQVEHRLKKVAIVDFDVHHGNGTEDIFRNEPSVFFSSTFQHPFYPGSGANTVSEHIVNVPLPAGTEGPQFRAEVERKTLPALNEFRPEIVFVSAGFDAHNDDPLASLGLLEDDYFWITRKLKETADTHAQGRLVSVLEGGYDLPALARSVEAHLKALL